MLLSEWKRARKDKEKYRRGKKKYKKLCDKKKEKKEFVKEAREERTQRQVWEVINKERKRRVEIKREIKLEKWDKYFMQVLGGREARRKRKTVAGRRGEGREKRKKRERV